MIGSVKLNNLAPLKKALDALNASRSTDIDLQGDPLQFAHRYTDPLDQELTAVMSSMLAYGRVSLFLPVIERWLNICDANGGPRQFVDDFSAEHIPALSGLSYRWNKEPHFTLVMFTLQEVLTTYTSLKSLFEQSHHPDDVDINPTLSRVMDIFHDAAVRIASKAQITATTFNELPDGFRRFFSSPRKGSACKRWHMLLRWMVRKTSPDLGLWDLPVEKLCIPLDVHVHSISQLLGLTTQRSANLKAAQHITSKLRQISPTDPIQYDFALAHLGISGQCKKTYDSQICPNCPLHAPCIHTKDQHHVQK